MKKIIDTWLYVVLGIGLVCIVEYPLIKRGNIPESLIGKCGFSDFKLNTFDFLSWLDKATNEKENGSTNNHRDPCPFSVIIFPDTQIYSKDSRTWRKSSRKEIFTAMTGWVKERAKVDNIKFLLHMGDVVNDDDEIYQWENANNALSILDDAVPYVIAVGNHDMVAGNPKWIPDSSRNTTNFNHFFPFSRFETQKWYGGRMADDYDNSFHFFEEGGLEFIIISLAVAPTDEMLNWAESILKQYASKRAIIITHSYMLADDRRDYPGGFGYLPANGNTGEEIWNKLIKKHANISLVLSGHVTNDNTHKGLMISRGDNGNQVIQLLSGEGHDGWLRILQFIPSKNKIKVQSYSPWHPKSTDEQYLQYPFSLPGYNTDSLHQYELAYNMNSE
ncbi:metallophosphoesterase [Agriterribacter sp.]|uniref:metallophosphoesterase n=1 Tax=Agriterribacter sp. TaxID=2821509 RepID=UPI002B58B176|nr:metallophosphoesterase [Agriterribacter sp.]HRO45748.1 metallophosphoesterase [Agriterribacter sp.]HRQ15774.1 metallophosphoesterase [Agriterribacter sp.]